MSEEENKSRNRSPNYPYLSLPEAINRTCVVLEKDKLSPTSPEVIAGHLGYAKLHGTSRRVLAAMKDYGLLDDAGNKRLKVSNLGYRLCKNNESPFEREKLLKEAALKPFIFHTVVEHFNGDIPSPATIEDYLILEKEFSPDGASNFQKVLRETVEFANLNSNDFSENPEDTANNNDFVNSKSQTETYSDFTDFFEKTNTQTSNNQNTNQPKLLFKYNVPLSIQRNINAQLIITGDLLKKRDLEVLSRKVKYLVDAFEDESEEQERESSPQSTFNFQ